MRHIHYLPHRAVLMILALCSCPCAAEFEIASPFGEHMVLQRGMPIAVWGWGDPRTSVHVSVAGREASAIVDASGRWRLELPSLEAGGPHSFVARGGGTQIRYGDVLVGEVWICSGQSNMKMGYAGIPEIKKLAERSMTMPIRTFPVPTVVAFEPQERCKAQWTAAPPGSAVACAFAYDLHQATGVAVGIILSAWGSSSIEGWMPLDMVDELPHFKAEMACFERQDHRRVADLIAQCERGERWSLEDNKYLRKRPNILYNGMLHPLAPYGVRGLVWYQGEANAKSTGAMIQYGVSLRAWCRRMRRLWGREEFHLLAVMLPRFGHVLGSGKSKDVRRPDAHTWAWMRESQLQLLELPHTGVANTIDLGEAERIHARDKRPIGERLALLAQRDVLGQNVVAGGPRMTSVDVEGGVVRVRYADADGLTTTDGRPPSGFWMAGADRRWESASARIEGCGVLLSCPAVPRPEVIRYAFAAMPDVNLVNGAGLPALPFRTDKDAP